MSAVVVCGGGIAGLTSALVLARRGHDVTLVEQDGADAPDDAGAAWSDWNRRGVAQLRQFHGFTALGLRVLDAEAPDVVETLIGRGVPRTDLDAEVARAHPDLPPSPYGDLVMLHPRRTTIELTLREAALASSRVCWRPGERVLGVEERNGRVVGARTDRVTLSADLTVDATGRRPKSSEWLRAAGLPAGADEWADTGIVYFTRWYRHTGDKVLRGSGTRQDLGSTRVVVAPADGGRFSVAFMAAADDPALRRLADADVFQRVARSVDRVAPWVDADVATPDSKVLFMGGLRNRLRVIDGPDGPIPGIVAVGDAAQCTNPYFGRGMALAMRSVQLLADALDAATRPTEVAAHYRQLHRTHVEPWFHDSVTYDSLRTLWLRRARGDALTQEEEALVESDDARFLRLFPLVGGRDGELLRAGIAYIQSVLEPSALDDESLRSRVLAHDEADFRPPIDRAGLLALLAG